MSPASMEGQRLKTSTQSKWVFCCHWQVYYEGLSRDWEKKEDMSEEPLFLSLSLSLPLSLRWTVIDDITDLLNVHLYFYLSTLIDLAVKSDLMSSDDIPCHWAWRCWVELCWSGSSKGMDYSTERGWVVKALWLIVCQGRPQHHLVTQIISLSLSLSLSLYLWNTCILL